MTGILLIALGHPNYSRMAINLAASIRSSDKNVHVTLVHDGGYFGLSDSHKALFDGDILCPTKYYNTNGSRDYIKVKTRIYDLSPYQKTLYLDVDMVWLMDRPVSELLGSLDGVDFSIMNTGPEEKCYWADPEDLRSCTGSKNPMYVYYSELIYFEKNERVKDFFKEVKRAFDKPPASARPFAGSKMPDELAFIIASLQTGILPHKDNWMPIYWYFREKGKRHLQPYQLSDQFYGYSIGGNVTPEYAKAHYNNLVLHYAKTMGIKEPYQVRDKRSFIIERTKY